MGSLSTDLPWWLLLIRQKSLIGVLPDGHEIYKITKIAVIPLSAEEPQDLELEVGGDNDWYMEHAYGRHQRWALFTLKMESMLNGWINYRIASAAPDRPHYIGNMLKRILPSMLLHTLMLPYSTSGAIIQCRCICTKYYISDAPACGMSPLKICKIQRPTCILMNKSEQRGCTKKYALQKI